MSLPEGIDHEFRQVFRQVAAEKGGHMAIHHGSDQHGHRGIKIKTRGK
jgi:hypothetical protein